MPKKRNIFFIISAVVLIPVILGLTPVKFVQKLGSGCPLNNNKVTLSCNPCIYHSVTSQKNLNNYDYENHTIALPSPYTGLQLLAFHYGELLEPLVDINASPPLKSPPLRC